MLLLTPQEIAAQFGPSFPTGGARRFNADDMTVHRTATHIFEFGYLAGFTFYAVIQKRDGAIAAIERDALLASYNKAKGAWSATEGTAAPAAEGKKADAQKQPAPAGNAPLFFKFTPVEGEKNFPSPIFAAHQLQGRQLVMWHPQCQMDLAQLIKNPLVY